MADDLFALADLLKINDTSLADIEVTDLLNDAPFMSQALMYTPATHGTVHKYTKESAAPVVGFRAANAGRDLDSSEDTAVTATLQILDWSFLADKALADAYVRGGAEGWIAREGRRHLRAALFAYETQLFRGTVGGDASGFAGFADVLDDSDDSMVINAAGTTADTASSVWLVRVNEEDVTGVLGMDGVFDMGESTVIDATDATGKHYPAYYTPGTGYTGVQVGSAYSFARICNLTEDSGKGLTDALVYKALELFPSAKQPTHIVMNRRSRRQLQSSRTATNATGAPAPLPKEVENIPIVVTDAIVSAEPLLTAAA